MSEEASAPPASSQTAGHASLQGLRVSDVGPPAEPPARVRTVHSPKYGYGSAQRSAPLADASATVQDAARAHGLHNSVAPAAAKHIPAPEQPSSARAAHGLPLASRRHSNGHGSHSPRDRMQHQRDRSQERSHHSSSRDRLVHHRGKQSTGHGWRAHSPYSPSRAAHRPSLQSDSRGRSPAEGGSASQVASILQLLSAVTLQSIRKCVTRPMPLSNLTARMQEGHGRLLNDIVSHVPSVSGLDHSAEYAMHLVEKPLYAITPGLVQCLSLKRQPPSSCPRPAFWDPHQDHEKGKQPH